MTKTKRLIDGPLKRPIDQTLKFYYGAKLIKGGLLLRTKGYICIYIYIYIYIWVSTDTHIYIYIFKRSAHSAGPPLILACICNDFTCALRIACVFGIQNEAKCNSKQHKNKYQQSLCLEINSEIYRK